KVSDKGKELPKVLVSSKKRLRDVEEDLVKNRKMEWDYLLMLRSQRISSLIVRRISVSTPPTSGITISTTSKLTISVSRGDAST
ncbi:hypothetical protein Tco_0589733, partial [Tanacetum coccineum]